ncbi:MAG: cyclic-di-AMP receptor [Oscillospiraceae bacterium]|nr:cyclic-di-AMP receptor [Oscillospiraceae bacterium]
MKLIIAIVNNDDSAKAAYALTDAGFFMTKLSTTGGFLMVGNTTLLIGAEEDEVTKAMDILKSTCITRKQINPPTASFGVGTTDNCIPKEVTVGGATVFVLSIDSMEKI